MSDLSDRELILSLSAEPPPRLDKALAEVVPEELALSRSRLVKLIEEGAVSRMGGAVVTAVKTKGLPFENWQVLLPKPVALKAEAEAIDLDVVYEDDDVIVINKPAGMVVHPAPGSSTGTLVNALLHHCGDSLSGIGGAKRPGIVHRIDKDTSGLLIAAKNDAAHQGLARQFADHSVERHYRAFTFGCPSRSDPRLAGVSGVAFETNGVTRVSGNIARHKTDRKRMAVVANAGRHAITRFRVLESFKGVDSTQAAQIECWLETGRTHQIRVHLAHAGHGLIGDPVYGGRRVISAKGLTVDQVTFLTAFKRQALHAATLGCRHPVTGIIHSWNADMPDDMLQLRYVLSALSM